MSDAGFVSSALFEQRFWLQIFGDHGRFMFDALSPQETEELETSRRFVRQFDELLEKARRAASASDVAELNQEAHAAVQELRTYQLHLLRRHLEGRLHMLMPPTFLDHMLNELDDYLQIASYLLAGQAPPPMSALSLHLLWLDDAEGHAATIASDVDSVEAQVQQQAQAFTRRFSELHEKSLTFIEYARTGLTDFPALHRLNDEVLATMDVFRRFLHELLQLRLDNRLLGIIPPLMLDHMEREECYYLLKLSQAAGTQDPGCDPTHPRVEG